MGHHGFFGTLLFLLIFVVWPADAQNMLNYLCDDPKLPANLSIARELACADRNDNEKIFQSFTGIATFIPTDEAWKSHNNWLQTLRTNSRLRRQLLGGTLAEVTWKPRLYSNGRLGHPLRTSQFQLAYFPRTFRHTQPYLCLVNDSFTVPPVLGDCVSTTDPDEFDNGVICLYGDQLLMPTSIAELLDNAGAARTQTL